MLFRSHQSQHGRAKHKSLRSPKRQTALLPADNFHPCSRAPAQRGMELQLTADRPVRQPVRLLALLATVIHHATLFARKELLPVHALAACGAELLHKHIVLELGLDNTVLADKPGLQRQGRVGQQQREVRERPSGRLVPDVEFGSIERVVVCPATSRSAQGRPRFRPKLPQVKRHQHHLSHKEHGTHVSLDDSHQPRAVDHWQRGRVLEQGSSGVAHAL